MNKPVHGLNRLPALAALALAIFLIGGCASAGPSFNQPPPGFVALFDGASLKGWKGLVGNPITREKMPADEMAKPQAAADEKMRAHWRVEQEDGSGVLIFDGKGDALCTAKDYGDFELIVDWRIESGGDSGIYLRGSPQVQIWDNPIGSGGLYNNKKPANPSNPIVYADNVVGGWNRFRIKMLGEHVTVLLNGQTVTLNTVLENYWDRNRPIFPIGQIELQNHGSVLRFRDIFIREIPKAS